MRLVFIDLETGGLDWSKHPITQIAAVAVDEQLAELNHFEAKVEFDEATADPEALRLSSYDPAVWAKEAIDQGAACASLSTFLRLYDDVKLVSKRSGKPYYVAQLVGYNAATFDGPFIQELYRRRGEFLPAAFRVMCVMQRVLWYFNEHGAIEPPSDFKLATVCAHFGVELTNAHDALADCRATVALCRALTAIQLRGQQ